MSFVHLHTHTQYSIKDATNKISEYVSRVKELGMNACAITDHGVMYGCIEFYQECKKQGIKPILGCEVYVAPGSRLTRGVDENEDRYYHLILLAENDLGYYNLSQICSQGFIDGFYYKPRVDVETLEKYHEGIICLSACLAGEVARNLAAGRYDMARDVARKYRDIFGKDNYFLEMQDHGIATQKTVNQGLLRLHMELGIPLVATNDCHYTMEEDAEIHDILLCMQGNHLVTDTDRRRYEGTQFYVKSEREMRKLFPYAEEAIDNTQLIADRCNVEIKFGERKLPSYDVPEGYDAWTYLNKLCNDGLIRRYGDRAEEARPRLDHELSVIREMGFVDYFLIVWDFINYGRTHGGSIGPGRGSAAGSLVSYTTGITDIDPLRYDLLFERFLNIERVSMPDIDVDFDDDHRGMVIDYVTKKYGADCVTQINVFGTYAAKNAIKSVGRVLGIPLPEVNAITKTVPNGAKMTIDTALKESADFRTFYETDDTVKDLIDKAKKLEGLPSNTTTHPSGVIIANRPMNEYVPLSRNETNGPLVTQYSHIVDEQLGLLKMDFLGLRTLTVIQDAVQMAEENHGVTIDIDHIDYDDPAVYQEIGSGHTDGIFQLESGGMESFMKELHPENLEDVTAGISLYRPGPMDFIPAYEKGKKNAKDVTYITPELEHILKPTYGVIVYQEQVMQIVRDLAGYSLGGADLVRRAMAKKHMDEMERERKRFVYGEENVEHPELSITGCVKNGVSEEAANQIFDQMIDFANYAFNKSHAACYAVVAYRTAYLRHYYPAEFMAALMTSFTNDIKKISKYIETSREWGIEVLPPDINEGMGKFSVQNGRIRFGMDAVKNVGAGLVQDIILEREENGKFITLYDFVQRMVMRDGSQVNKRAIENLIKSGALDSLDGNRRQMVMVYQLYVDEANREKKNADKDAISGQMDLFSMDTIPEEIRRKEEEKRRAEAMAKMPRVEEFDKKDLLMNEREVLGIYVSGHPLEDDAELMKQVCDAECGDFLLDEAEDGESFGEDSIKTTKIKDKEQRIIGGIITEVKPITTKRGENMAFVTLEDQTGSVEVIVFPRVYQESRHLMEVDRKVFIYGTTQTEDDKDAKMLANEIHGFEEVTREVWVQVPNRIAYEAKKEIFEQIPEEIDGRDTLIVYLKAEKQLKKFQASYDFAEINGNVSNLKAVFGEENVIVKEKPVEFKKKRY